MSKHTVSRQTSRKNRSNHSKNHALRKGNALMDGLLQRGGLELDPIGSDDADHLEALRQSIAEGLVRGAETINLFIQTAREANRLDEETIKKEINAASEVITEVSDKLETYKDDFSPEKIRVKARQNPAFSFGVINTYLELQAKLQTSLVSHLDTLESLLAA